eukprot:scaffold1307_cov166-Ochromonas_danica.AAC.44
MGNCGSDDSKIFCESYKQLGPLQEGDNVPNVVIKARVRVKTDDRSDAFAWKDIMTEQLFKGKRVVIFSIPGEEIKQLGIDEIYCLSVNDAFVMRQWGLMQGLVEERQDSSNPLNPGNFQRVKLIPDGAAKFTRAMGMICKFESIGGFGERSWRYSAVFNDMKIEKIFAEEGGMIKDDSPAVASLEVSDGITMVSYLKAQKRVEQQQ